MLQSSSVSPQPAHRLRLVGSKRSARCGCLTAFFDSSAVTVTSLLVMKVTVLLLACMTGSVSADYRRSACGQRLSGVRTLNVTVKDVFSVDKFTSDYETFPWLVPVKMTNSGREPTLLCSAVAISSYVALAPGQVTDSFCSVCFLYKIIDLPGGQINYPS